MARRVPVMVIDVDTTLTGLASITVSPPAWVMVRGNPVSSGIEVVVVGGVSGVVVAGSGVVVVVVVELAPHAATRTAKVARTATLRSMDVIRYSYPASNVPH